MQEKGDGMCLFIFALWTSLFLYALSLCRMEYLLFNKVTIVTKPSSLFLLLYFDSQIIVIHVIAKFI
jgi:hypothetical protein